MAKRQPIYPQIDIAKILLSPVTVRINDEVTKLHPFAAQLETCIASALRGNMASCAKLVRMCLKEGLIMKPTAYDDFRSREVIPKDWEWDDWMEMYDKYGSPPWSGPRDGLTAEEREKWHATQRKRSPKPKNGG